MIIKLAANGVRLAKLVIPVGSGFVEKRTGSDLYNFYNFSSPIWVWFFPYGEKGTELYFWALSQ